MPEPRSPQFGRFAAEKIRRLLDITQGRRFLPVHQLRADE